ncbi:MAG: hypothetical protein IKS46_02880 [Clostridia bacterium]|nr:hypothetical protein [Clostridia bacterium]
MKTNDLKIALQESLPEPPEGFDARSDRKLAALLSEEEHKVKKIPGFVIAVALVLVISMATALAAFNEDINRLLYQWWPEAAQALRPVNLSMEEAGIRLEVLSASVSKKNMLVTFSLTDLTGDRINENTECNGNLDGDVCLSSTGETELLSYDPDTHQAIFAGYSDYIPQPDSVRNLSNTNLNLHIFGISTPEITEINNLLPLMDGKEYTVEAVPCPSEGVFQTGYVTDAGSISESPEYPPVLNPERSLEIPLADGFTLSGIGWIDGIMHVQIHMPHCVKAFSSERSASIMNLAACTTDVYDNEGNWISCQNSDRIPFDVQCVGWTVGDDAWVESLYAFSREEMENYHLAGTFSNAAKFTELLSHDWYVEFPASLIQFEADQ